MSDSEPTQAGASGAKPARGRVELAATGLMAAAAVLTAWSAFQSAKWSGLQAIAYSEASAARTQAARAADRADQQVAIDADVFIAWAQAVAADIGPEEILAHGYAPKPGTLSTFFYKRFRKEFRPALEAWLETQPFGNADAPATPFEMPQYRLQAAEQSGRLAEKADDLAAAARANNQRSDRYVAMTVVFAVVFFFAGVGSKLEAPAVRRVMLGLGALFLVGAAAWLATFPVALG